MPPTESPTESLTESLTETEVFKLSDELVEKMAELRPISATFKGVPGHDHAWDDLSPAGAARVAAELASFKRRLRARSPAKSAWEKLAALVMDDILDQELDQLERADPLNDLNSIQSSFQMLRMVFDCMDTSSRAGWENIVRRLETLDTAAAGLRASFEAGRAEGRVVAKRQVLAGIEQGRAHASEGSFFGSLPDLMAKAGVEDATLKARLKEAIPRARGAFSDLARYLEETYLPSAGSKDAVGRERYLIHARRFLGMDLDPVDTYAWGFEEVRSIQAEMQRLAAEILPGASLPEVIKLLKTDPARCAKSPEDLVRLMLERQARALSELDGTHFDIPDALRALDVKLTPPGGPLGAYYISPTEDFSRPGTVWYSLGDAQIIPLYDQIATAYHEGFPGHHLQCGLQVSLKDRLCRFHRLAEAYSGYAEGWALYTEKLMNELGYYEKPEYVLGMLCAQMMRACRVVIDIGSHLELPIPDDSPFRPGASWSFDLGVEMMTTVAFLPEDHARSEMTRYLGWPGQAISYKVGERVILGLREEYRKLRGDAFNLREFHAKVVGTGAVGLSLLRELVLSDRLS